MDSSNDDLQLPKISLVWEIGVVDDFLLPRVMGSLQMQMLYLRLSASAGNNDIYS